MIKKYGIWYAVKYYCIVQFLLFAIVLIFSNDYIFEITCEYMNITERTPLYNLYKLAVPIGLATLWLMIVFTVCRDKRYRYLTGRTYGADHSKY